MTTDSRQSLRFPALDGLRAVAVVAVMLYHWFVPGFFPGGYVGVDIFFVLSGFLITSLLIDEWGRRGRIGLGDFYARRALRLLPALVAVAAVSVVVISLHIGAALRRDGTIPGLPWAALFLANWAQAFNANPYSLGFLGHTWSLAIEEQFYLLWPLAFVVLAVRRWSPKVSAATMVGLAGLEWVWRAVLYSTGAPDRRVALGTDSHSDGLLIGCALAFLIASRLHRRGTARSATVSHLGAVSGVVAVAVVCIHGVGTGRAGMALAYTLIPLATAAIVYDQVTSPLPVLARVLTARPMVWTGRRSYGLYLWHIPIYFALDPVVPGWRLHGLIGAALTFVVAAASWRFLEAPVNRYRRRFSHSDVGVPTDVTVAP